MSCICSTITRYRVIRTGRLRWLGCCNVRGPGGERIVDVVPGGRELKLKLRWGVGQAVHTRNNPHFKCTGVFWA